MTFSKKMPRYREKEIFLVFFCFLTIVVASLIDPHGILVNDEGTYQMMARDFAESGSLVIWNGYEEFPSLELTLQHTVVQGDRLAPHYPYLSAVLNAPLYRLFGYQGLLILNAIAFVAAVGLSFRLARKLFGDSALALNACLILVFATFSWEYTQGAWPHTVSMLFVIASAYLAATAFVTPKAGKAAVLALGAGVVVGFGAGVRLDTIFLFPVLVIPFIFVRPWRPWCALAVCLGTVPGLAVLTATTYAKFGKISPFVYVPSVSGGAADPRSYLPVVFLGLAVLAGAWMISRARGQVLTRTNRWVVAVGLVGLAGIVFLMPAYRDFISGMANGTYQLLVDLRILDIRVSGNGLTRGPGGGLVYIGSVKKALIQSSPYLVVLAIPAVMLLRGAKHNGLALGMLLLAPAAFVAPYALFAWHGGASLNLRYFIPILPFTSILAAFAWREVTRDLPDKQLRLAAISAGATVALYAVIVIIGPALAWGPLTIAQQEAVFLTLPLGIALCALALILGHLFRPGAVPRAALPAVLAVGLAWSGLVAFTYDLPRAYTHRRDQAALFHNLARFIEQDSLVMTLGMQYFTSLPADRRARIARPRRDDFKDFHRLVAFHLDRNRPVYAWVIKFMEKEMRERQLFNAYAVVPLYEDHLGRFVQLLRPAERRGPESSG